MVAGFHQAETRGVYSKAAEASTRAKTDHAESRVMMPKRINSAQNSWGIFFVKNVRLMSRKGARFRGEEIPLGGSLELCRPISWKF